jgi:Transposase DDE domain
MSRPTSPAYKTKNWPAYNKALKRRGSLTIWFDPEMTWAAAPTGKRGRQPDYSDAAIQTCLTMKVLFGMALRQTTGFVESLLGLIGLDWAVPDFSTLSRRQKTLKVNIPYRGSDGPLHLLIDIEPVSATGSSEPARGIKVEGEGEWNARKHGGTKRRVWRKIHIGIDEKSLEIRAAEFTTSDVGDAPMLPELLDQIPPEQEIGSVTADGAFDTRKCHDAIAARSAVAIIPPRKNAKPWKPDTPGAVARNEILRTSKRVGRAIWRRWSGYHRRSRAETKMHCVKLLGQRLSARDFDRQVSEFQVRVAVLNGFTALGTPITEVAG